METGKIPAKGNAYIGFEVKDFEKTVKAFEKKGIKFDFELDEIIKIANFKDPDGTQLYFWEYA